MQYNVGTVSVTNGSSVVTGTGTKWSSNVDAGNLFTITGSGVLYDIASVDNDTQITLSAPYAGSTASGQTYTTAQSFTPNYSIPYPEIGDVQTATIMKRSIQKIDSLFALAAEANVTIDVDAPLVAGKLPVATDGNTITDSGKVPPSGEIVGTTDAQTLSGKTISGASNTLSNIAAGSLKLGAGIEDDGSGNITTGPSMQAMDAGDIVGDLTWPDAHTTLVVHNDGTTVTLTSTPPVGAKLILYPFDALGDAMYVNFNGVQARLPGAGGHNIPFFAFKATKENAYCELHYTGVEWESSWCSHNILTNSLPTGMPLGLHGQIQFSYDSVAGVFKVVPYKGLGFVEVSLYTQRVLPSGVTYAASGTTANAINYFYLRGQDLPMPSAIADNGSGKIRLTVDSSPLNAGDQAVIVVWGISGFPKANGLMRCVGVDGTHIDLPDVSSTGLSPGAITGSTTRLLRLYASTTGPTRFDAYGVMIENGGNLGTYVGCAALDGSKVPTMLLSHENGDVAPGEDETPLASGDLSFGTGAGTGPVLNSISGTDRRFRLNFTTGTSPATSANILTVTFKKPFCSIPFCTITPEGVSAAVKAPQLYVVPTATGLTLATGTAGLAASTNYSLSIQCLA